MKNIRVLLAGLTIMAGSILSAQEKENVEIRKNAGIYEVTFYHDNGQIAQEGYFKKGKLHGEWFSYDQAGYKVSLGKISEGKKVGKWFFWEKEQLSEVDFNDQRIAAVKTWKIKDALVSK